MLAGDKELQAKAKEMIAAGVRIEACKACADLYGVSQLGIDVKYRGEPLPRILQSDKWDTMTFWPPIPARTAMGRQFWHDTLRKIVYNTINVAEGGVAPVR